MDRFFELIVGEHRTTVFGLLFSLLRDRDLAEDLTQETFVVLLKKVDDIDVSQPILPWLLTTARNLAANAQRRRKLEQTTGPNGWLRSANAERAYQLLSRKRSICSTTGSSAAIKYQPPSMSLRQRSTTG